MTLAHDTTIYDVADLHVWPMLTDATGASPTYGTAVDVPGVSAVSLDPTIVANALKGDGRTIARRARIDEFAFKATYAKFSADVLTVAFGFHTATDAGSTPNMTASVDLTLPKALPLFAVRFVIDDTDLGIDGITLTCFKVQLTGGSLFDTSSDSFGEPTLEASAYAPQHQTNLAGTKYVDYTPTVDAKMWESLPASLTTMPI